jgi:hypothetical protein
MNDIVAVDPEGGKKSQNLWNMFVNFMENGGILVVLFVVIIICMIIPWVVSMDNISKEAKMNNTEISQTEVVEKKVEKKKRSAWDIFVTFMAMGGFLVVMVVGVVILVFVYWLTKWFRISLCNLSH